MNTTDPEPLAAWITVLASRGQLQLEAVSGYSGEMQYDFDILPTLTPLSLALTKLYNRIMIHQV